MHRIPGTLLAALLCVPVQPLLAGNPIRVTLQGQPIRWENSTPIIINLDQGPLGELTNAEAKNLVWEALARWSEVPEVKLQFTEGSPMPFDVDNVDEFSFVIDSGNFTSVVIFDNNGGITEALGIDPNSVLGFAGPTQLLGSQITEGQAVLNGKFLDGIQQSGNPETSLAGMRGTMVHEFGHMLGLGHSDCNGTAVFDNAQDPVHGAPSLSNIETMFPFIIESSAETPHFDDISMMAQLYPANEITPVRGSASGRVLFTDGSAARGVNVILRHEDSFYDRAAAQVTGAFAGPVTRYGEYRIRNLIPGRYFARISSIQAAGWSQPVLSNTGDVTSEVIGFYPGPDDYWDEREGTGEDPELRDPFRVDPDQETTDLDVTFNNRIVLQSAETPVVETEPNNTTATAPILSVPFQVSGTVSLSEDGGIFLSGDDFEDLYAFDLAQPTSLEITLEFRNSIADLDLVLANTAGNVSQSSLSASDDEFIRSYQLRAGRHIVGVSYWDGYPEVNPGFTDPVTYTLSVDLVQIIPAPLEGDRLFTFDSGSQGWFFVSVPPFTQPLRSVSGSSLNLISTDNTNTFGFFDSPIIELPTGSVTLKRARYTVVTNVAPELSPTFRLRSTATDFQRSSLLVYTSSGDASGAPSTTGKAYDLYFPARAQNNSLRLGFDLLNFIPDDAANGSISALDVDLLTIDGLSGMVAEKTYSFFGGQDQGWKVETIPVFLEGSGQATQDGLELVGQPAAASVQFASWASPLQDAVVLAAGRLYEVTYEIGTAAAPEQRTSLPVLRARLSDEELEFTSLHVLESTSDGSYFPSAGSPRAYDVHLAVPPEMDGRRLRLFLDLLATGEPGEDPTIPVYLRNVTVRSYLLPE